MPWRPADYLRSLGCEAASLDLRRSQTVFVVAGVTSQNQGFLGPNAEPEPEYDWGTEADEQGVVGGVAGGAIEDAPMYATAGYRKPQMVTPRCVQGSVRIPADLQGFTPITVQFAVLRDGSPSQFKVITRDVPDRIVTAIWAAVQGCKWIPGADPAGRPANVWVILPLRLSAP